ncbi:MAG: hypothetical protein ACKOTZ_10590 [Chloroflexota bacterium]
MPRLFPVRAAWTAGAVLVLAAAPAAAMDPSPSPVASPAASAAPFESILDDRYCEIIPSVTEGDTTSSYVWNTIGFNDCPSADWIRLSEDDINAAFGSQVAKKNGPRHWTLDAITATGGATTSGETFTFGNIEMGLRAIITTPADQPTVGETFYVPNEVQRQTIFTFLAGTEVYELTDPDGNVYIMQSYATMKDRNLTRDQLAGLGERLDLPEGWTFAARTLTEQLEVVADGIAYVVNDDLYNSYQRR